MRALTKPTAALCTVDFKRPFADQATTTFIQQSTNHPSGA